MTNFTTILEAVRANPTDFLDCPCALSLSAFLVGYKLVDESVADIEEAMQERIAGPSQANGCTRAYLARGGGVRSFIYAIDELHDIASSVGAAPRSGSLADAHFSDYLRTALSSGRLGMYFGETTIMWVANFVRGFLSGKMSLCQRSGEGEVAALRNFEEWLRIRYREPAGTWSGIVRVFEGEGERGISAFLKRWDEFRGLMG